MFTNSHCNSVAFNLTNLNKYSKRVDLCEGIALMLALRSTCRCFVISYQAPVPQSRETEFCVHPTKSMLSATYCCLIVTDPLIYCSVPFILLTKDELYEKCILKMGDRKGDRMFKYREKT
jgi:hypothetical protein